MKPWRNFRREARIGEEICALGRGSAMSRSDDHHAAREEWSPRPVPVVPPVGRNDRTAASIVVLLRGARVLDGDSPRIDADVAA